MDDVVLHQVEGEGDTEAAGSLIREYLEGLNDRLRRDHGIEFDVEAMVKSDLSDRQKFHPPHGRFYLARFGQRTAGVGCLKKLDPDIGEIQRMYVAPAYRGKGIGRAIARRLIEDARSIGYRHLRLESLQFLHAAHSLYRSEGFRETGPYPGNSMGSYQSTEQLDRYYSITVFMELDLHAGLQAG